MKIMTVIGTRPEIIRLSRVIPVLDQFCQHIVVHTGQNYEPGLNDVFFSDLRLRPPDYFLECAAETSIQQIAAILSSCEKVILKEKPDRLLILGDTNSALAGIAAKKLGIPVFHMEAGNRCYDDRVPEEVNRRLVDHCSDILLPYTERSRMNLVKEGIASHKIFVTGNPIYEVLEYYSDQIESSQSLVKTGVEPGEYFLATLHRAENVDVPERLNQFMEAFQLLHLEYELPVIISLHPRTRSRLDKGEPGYAHGGVKAIEPQGLFDFIKLEKQACCVLSDSGTVQEECCIFQIPNVTLRDVTERPETVEMGSSIISGCEPQSILEAVHMALSINKLWEVPEEYIRKSVSRTVAKIILGVIPT